MSDDVFQDYADMHGVSRAEAKERMFRVLYGGPPRYPTVNIGDRVQVTMIDGDTLDFEVKSARFSGSYDGYPWTSSMTGRFRANHPPMHTRRRDDPLGGVEPDENGVYNITTKK